MSQTEESTDSISPINWILIHGNARSGTGYMARLISKICNHSVLDWGLRDLMISAAENLNAKMDAQRLLRDISDNIIANSRIGNNAQFDLVFKQAFLEPEEQEVLMKMWGPPAKNIYCFRSPDEYIHSALKKFPDSPEAGLQQAYENQFGRFRRTGGELFEYHSKLTIEDYLNFLSPMEFDKNNLESFTHKGVKDVDKVTRKMWDVYKQLRELRDLNV
jgi:hypothetical protein